MRLAPHVASARTARCPTCRARVWVPFDYCLGWAFDVDTDWIRTGQRIVEAHTDAAHPGNRPWPVGYYSRRPR